MILNVECVGRVLLILGGAVSSSNVRHCLRVEMVPTVGSRDGMDVVNEPRN